MRSLFAIAAAAPKLAYLIAMASCFIMTFSLAIELSSYFEIIPVAYASEFTLYKAKLIISLFPFRLNISIDGNTINIIENIKGLLGMCSIKSLKGRVTKCL